MRQRPCSLSTIRLPLPVVLAGVLGLTAWVVLSSATWPRHAWADDRGAAHLQPSMGVKAPIEEVLHCTLACSRKSEVERVDAQRFHQMQDMKFFLDRGIPHGWRLQSVTQSLIVEENPPGGTQRGGILLVPVVDELRSFHNH